MSSWSWTSIAKPASRMCSIQTTQQPQLAFLWTTSRPDSAGGTGLCAGATAADRDCTGAVSSAAAGESWVAEQAPVASAPAHRSRIAALFLKFMRYIPQVDDSKPETDAGNDVRVASCPSCGAAQPGGIAEAALVRHAHIGSETAVGLVPQPQPGFDRRQAGTDAAGGIRLAVDRGFEHGLEDKPVAQQEFVLDLDAQHAASRV